MTLTDRIEVNPRVMLGKAVIRGTRVPVELVLRKLSEGASEADFRANTEKQDAVVRRLEPRFRS